MKKFNKIFALMIFAFCFTFVLFSLKSEAATIKISKTSNTILKGETYKLSVSGASKKVTWKSSNKAVATVNSNGTVTALNKGTVTITATVSGKKLTCKITIQAPSLNKTSITLDPGKTYSLKVSGTSKSMYWGTTNKNVVTVTSDGIITAVGAGTANISVYIRSVKYTCVVTVNTNQNTKFTEGTYKVGTDITEGQYAVFATNGNGYFTISNALETSIGSTIAKDSFEYNSIITVSKGQYITLGGCYAKPFGWSLIQYEKSGMFLVGYNINVGDYTLTQTGTTAKYTIYKDSLHQDSSVVSTGTFSGNTAITVATGQYLELTGCKISD